MNNIVDITRSFGFGSVSQFIGYCEEHSKTERALFNGAQINTLHMLAGRKSPNLNTMQFKRAHPDTCFEEGWPMSRLCTVARENHAEPV